MDQYNNKVQQVFIFVIFIYIYIHFVVLDTPKLPMGMTVSHSVSICVSWLINCISTLSVQSILCHNSLSQPCLFLPCCICFLPPLHSLARCSLSFPTVSTQSSLPHQPHMFPIPHSAHSIITSCLGGTSVPHPVHTTWTWTH